MSGGYSDKYLNSTEIFIPEENRWCIRIAHIVEDTVVLNILYRWRHTGSTMYPRQGAQIAVLGGRPTVLGGFHDYDKYPDMVEQYDVNSGKYKSR